MYLDRIDNEIIVFDKKIKKLFLENISNSTIVLNQKCLTTITLLRCRNVKLICKKQVYNIEIELCCEIDIKIEDKYIDLVYLWITACIDLRFNKELMYSPWANESFQNCYYKDIHYSERYRGSKFS